MKLNLHWQQKKHGFKRLRKYMYIKKENFFLQVINYYRKSFNIEIYLLSVSKNIFFVIELGMHVSNNTVTV